MGLAPPDPFSEIPMPSIADSVLRCQPWRETQP